MRSQLFVPANSEKKIAKGMASQADCLILDLEDSLTPEQKPTGRKIAAAFLQDRGQPDKQVYIRINSLETPHALADLAAITAGKPDGIVLPKCRSGEDVKMLDHYLSALEAREGIASGSIKILPIVTELAAGLFKMESYTGCSPRLSGLMWGAEDLAADIGARANRKPGGEYDDPYRLARTATLLGAAAAGVMPVDAVYIDFNDLKGLQAECVTARRAGFQAKAAIHPAQLDTINRAFSITAEETDWARKVIKAFADNPEAGVVGLEGVMIDKPHLKQAERILAAAGEKKEK